jgi:hypothetical protein
MGGFGWRGRQRPPAAAHARSYRHRRGQDRLSPGGDAASTLSPAASRKRFDSCSSLTVRASSKAPTMVDSAIAKLENVLETEFAKQTAKREAQSDAK